MNAPQALHLSLDSATEEIEEIEALITIAAKAKKTYLTLKKGISNAALRYFQGQGFRITYLGKGNISSPTLNW